MQILTHVFARAVTLAQLLLNPLMQERDETRNTWCQTSDREKDVMEYVLLSAIVLLIPGALILAVSLLAHAFSSGPFMGPFMPLARLRSQQTTPPS